MNPETRDEIKIPESFVYEAVLQEAGAPNNLIYLSSRSSTTNEQIWNTERFLKLHPNELDPKVSVISHEPFAQKRAMASLPFWMDIWRPEWFRNNTRFVSRTPFNYELSENMDRAYILYLLQLALSENGRIGFPFEINIGNATKTLKTNIPEEDRECKP